MKVTLINVSSIDGKLTKGTRNNIYEWSSPEDFAHFKQTLSQHNLIVMGSGTFNHVKDNETAGLKPEKERLRIILTSKPETYKQYAVPGQMEFSDETPTKLINRLEKLGYKQMLLVSGGKVATSFFKANLIDDLWITIEPKIFGTGEPLVQEEAFDISLQLFETKRLNENGALLLKYRIHNNESNHLQNK
jgi:dihydrofolate reductase